MWPLPAEHERLVHELGQLIARGGAWRFLHGPVVAANTRDYPDKWEENRDGVARALARTLWHARLDLDATVEDVRAPGPRNARRLRKTQLELVRVDATRVELELGSVGNDDVAGILAHQVGRVFVAHLDHGGHPLRTGGEALPDAAAGSLAAVYLGLGVVATNASQYARAAGELVGRTAYHEHEIDRIGGLSPEDLAFLLAVQATVRDDVLPALDTLARTHADEVAAWREVLDDHEDELRVMLELPGDAGSPPARPDAPRAVTIKAAWSEADLTKHNHGQRVFRYPETKAWTTAPLAAIVGFIIGTALGIKLDKLVLLGVVPLVGFIGGLIYGLARKQLRCTSCGCFLTPTDTGCRLCGGNIAGDVKNIREALDRDDELQREQA